MPAMAGIQANACLYVYILASDREGRLYVGAARLIYGHPNDLVEGFTKRHGVHKLVWFERHRDGIGNGSYA